MASVTVNIPDALLPTVEAALCAAGGFADVTPANAKKAVINWIITTVQNVQASQQAVTPPVPAPITGLT